ncbi:MAG: hypothetical protein L0G22_02520 [Propionibacteriaceae bacterium]|nr:hypothetical protein [Propionibacteriaceae bacterium]
MKPTRSIASVFVATLVILTAAAPPAHAAEGGVRGDLVWPGVALASMCAVVGWLAHREPPTGEARARAGVP